MKEDIVIVGEDRNIIPRKRWALTSDAFLTVFLTIPRNPVVPSPKKRKSPAERNANSCKIRKMLVYPRLPRQSTSAAVDQIMTGPILEPNENCHVADIRNFDDVKILWNKIQLNYHNWDLEERNSTLYIMERSYGKMAEIKKQIEVRFIFFYCNS